MSRTILFDMGNVLLKFDPHLFVQRLHCTDEEEHILINELFRSPEWVMADRGIIDDDELVSRIQKRLPASLHETAEQLIRHWDEPRIPMPGAYELLKDLKDQDMREATEEDAETLKIATGATEAKEEIEEMSVVSVISGETNEIMMMISGTKKARRI